MLRRPAFTSRPALLAENSEWERSHWYRQLVALGRLRSLDASRPGGSDPGPRQRYPRRTLIGRAASPYRIVMVFVHG